MHACACVFVFGWACETISVRCNYIKAFAHAIGIPAEITWRIMGLSK